LERGSEKSLKKGRKPVNGLSTVMNYCGRIVKHTHKHNIIITCTKLKLRKIKLFEKMLTWWGNFAHVLRRKTYGCFDSLICVHFKPSTLLRINIPNKEKHVHIPPYVVALE
jgi:hypothetical protein